MSVLEKSKTMTPIDGLLKRPRGAKVLYVLGHGAGAGMRHAFLEEISERLAQRKVATYRYEFPYMTAGKRRPDTPRVLQETVRTAVEAACKKASALPVLAGGKSMGGRMTSLAASTEPLPGVEGLVFLGFPLHAPGRVGDSRADHLAAVTVPMLFIQGTRDSLADLDRIKGVSKRLGKRSTLHIVDGGDHSFNVLKRSGRDPSEVMEEIVQTIALWADKIL
jgi:predicted alpha/beta-hydrolase family hydrolase